MTDTVKKSKVELAVNHNDDAFELAVRFKAVVAAMGTHTSVYSYHFLGSRCDVPHGDDAEAATRKAIVGFVYQLGRVEDD